MHLDESSFLFNIPEGKRPTTARKIHICRLYDILQICIQRNDMTRARRAWSILVRCKEINWKVMWRTGLLLVNGQVEQGHSANDEGKLEYLSTVMLQYPEAVSSLVTLGS